MRISSEQANFIKEEISNLLPGASVYLFGSRVDDGKKGGDIDIMVLSERRLNWKEKSRIRWNYFGRYGEQKFDIVSFSFEDESPFKQLVIRKGKRL